MLTTFKKYIVRKDPSIRLSVYLSIFITGFTRSPLNMSFHLVTEHRGYNKGGKENGVGLNGEEYVLMTATYINV